MSIGTERESSLHKQLKNIFTNYNGRTEIKTNSFICDGVKNDGSIVEVQLGSFGPLKRKISALNENQKIIIAHPVILTKEIITFNTNKEAVSVKKSPRKGSMWDLFKALVYAPLSPLHPNVSIALVFVNIIETRIDDGNGSWRRGGKSILDRELISVEKVMYLKKIDDYKKFIPFLEKEEWTVKELAAKAGVRPPLAYKTVYVLAKTGVIKKTGKKGREQLWKL
ncbi:MAG: hypothetical protein LBC53_07140 [Spirochaetaceae bacterium]|nr:hypothetical protein [Spirochaetaceae bacterium]